MRARFARTLRYFMRDSEIYQHPGTHVWNAADSACAYSLLKICSQEPTLPNEVVVQIAHEQDPTTAQTVYERVWARMQTFPYIFEVAAARGNLDTLHLDGTSSVTRSPTAAPSITAVKYAGWKVTLKDFQAFRGEDKLSPALFEHFAQCFREQAPPNFSLSIQATA